MREFVSVDLHINDGAGPLSPVKPVVHATILPPGTVVSIDSTKHYGRYNPAYVPDRIYPGGPFVHEVPNPNRENRRWQKPDPNTLTLRPNPYIPSTLPTNPPEKALEKTRYRIMIPEGNKNPPMFTYTTVKAGKEVNIIHDLPEIGSFNKAGDWIFTAKNSARGVREIRGLPALLLRLAPEAALRALEQIWTTQEINLASYVRTGRLPTPTPSLNSVRGAAKLVLGMIGR